MGTEQSRSNEQEIQSPTMASWNTQLPLTWLSIHILDSLLAAPFFRSMPLPSDLWNQTQAHEFSIMAFSVPLASWLWPDGLCWWLSAMPFERPLFRMGALSLGLTKSYTYWVRQDPLLLHAIIASVSESGMPILASIFKNISWSLDEAWQTFIQIDLAQELWIRKSGSPSLAMTLNLWQKTCTT